MPAKVTNTILSFFKSSVMKSVLPFFAIAIIFTSCSSVYKTGQTPDDVYFSPARPAQSDEYVRSEQKDDSKYRNEDDRYRNEENRYRNEEDYYNDRYLRMKVRNRYVWSDLDYYYTNPYAYSPYAYKRFNCYCYDSPWNTYSLWNYYYNPYSTRVVVVNPKSTVYNKPRTSNLHVFDMTSTNPKIPNTNNKTFRGSTETRNNTNRDFGRDLRNIFGNSSNNSSSSSSPSKGNSSNQPASSSNTESKSNSSSSGNAPVRKF